MSCCGYRVLREGPGQGVDLACDGVMRAGAAHGGRGESHDGTGGGHGGRHNGPVCAHGRPRPAAAGGNAPGGRASRHAPWCKPTLLGERVCRTDEDLHFPTVPVASL